MVENILLITVDSLRYDVSEPIDRVLPGDRQSEADVFSRAYATGPGTTPSFPAMLTGTLPLSHGGLGPLTGSRPGVSSFLRREGLRTGGFQCNPFLSRHFNYDEGYDEFRDYQNPLMGIATRVFPRGIEINNPRLRRIDDVLHVTDAIKKSYQLVKGKPRPYVSAKVITDDTVEWLAEVDEPFFCWTHYMDVHHPCHPPEPYRENHGVGSVTQSEVSQLYSNLLQDSQSLTEDDIQDLKSLYRASIAYTYDQVERILDHLQASGQYDETLVVLTSDHGELFGEYGQYGKPERMYDELLRVPLVVANGPETLADATRDLVSLVDIPPVCHDALGVDVPEEYVGQIPGKDEPRDVVLAEHEVEGDVIVGARSENWLYEADEIESEHRLFDLRDSGFERVDPDHPGGSTARDAVLARLDELDVTANYLQGEMGDEIEDRLENLGYL